MRRSLSALDRLRVCPGSGVLPAIAHRGVDADVGSAVHDWIHAAAVEGPREANANRGAIADAWELDGEGRDRFHRMLDVLDGCPAPAGALTELPLALLEDGSVVPIEGGRGTYPEIHGLVLPGTIDAVWCERDGNPVEFEIVDGRLRCPVGATLWVVDWKTGEPDYVTPIRRNWQLRGAAVLAARYFEATAVVIAIGFVDEWGMRWEVRTDRWGRALPMDAAELDLAESEVREIVRKVAAQDPANPKVVRCEHCRFCDSKIACPAFVAAPRAMIEAVVDGKPGALTRDQAKALLPIVMQTKRATEMADGALKDHAREHGPIPLPGGKEWGPGEVRKATFDTALAFPIVVEALSPVVGEERALEIVHAAFWTSKTALGEAAGLAVDEENARRKERGERAMTKKSVRESLFSALAEAGAMIETIGEEFDARWPADN